jgi:hypothetical protein
MQRQPIRQVDAWLGALEELILQEHRVVPEPLYGEINTFIEGLDSRLRRRLGWTPNTDPTYLLDKMFYLQEMLLPRCHQSNWTR